MHKLISFVRRKAGTSHAEFKDYYERYHSKLGIEFLPPLCKKYLRRYITPIRHPMKTDQPPHPEFDCLVEFWFEDEAACRQFEASVSDPARTRYIIEDEEKFVDRANTFRFVVEDHLEWGPPEQEVPMPKPAPRGTLP
jgi:hypothetical protein